MPMASRVRWASRRDGCRSRLRRSQQGVVMKKAMRNIRTECSNQQGHLDVVTTLILTTVLSVLLSLAVLPSTAIAASPDGTRDRKSTRPTPVKLLYIECRL